MLFLMLYKVAVPLGRADLAVLHSRCSDSGAGSIPQNAAGSKNLAYAWIVCNQEISLFPRVDS